MNSTVSTAPAALKRPHAQPPGYAERNVQYWRRNLVVCVFGSFTTLVSLSMLLPFLPLYVRQLGVTSQSAVIQWSGIAFGATFLGTALTAPLWGRLADRFGRKPMLVRAAIGMAVVMSLIGVAHNVYELVALRLIAGLVGGYASASTVMVGTQAPRERAGWALGILSTGALAGNLVGPLVGGVLPDWIGIRGTFFAGGAMIAAAALLTILVVKEDFHPASDAQAPARDAAATPARRANYAVVAALLVTAMMVLLANMSIEPIITIYVGQLVDASRVTIVSGIAMSAAALGSILSASRLGRIADRSGHWRVMIGALVVSALLLIPQAFVTTGWQLVALRFLMGLALGGLLPCITSIIRHNVPDGIVGRVLGYSTSSQYAGQVVGPLLGGFVGGHIGMRAVFLGTSLLMGLGAVYASLVRTDRH